jgi:uncharacterized membrane protein YfcA
MLRWAIIFLVVALVAAVFGFTGIRAVLAMPALQSSPPILQPRRLPAHTDHNFANSRIRFGPR